MKQKKRMQRKILLSMIGLVVLLLIASTYVIRQKVLQPQGDYITRTEVRNELDAFCQINEQKDAFSEGLLLLTKQDGFLTYQEAKEISSILKTDLPFINRYGKKSSILISDWTLYLDLLVEQYGQNEITKEEIALVAMGDQVSGENGICLEEQEVLTANGTLQDLSGKAEEYLNEKVSAVLYNGSILSITECLEPKLQLKNVYITNAAELFSFFWKAYEITVPCENDDVIVQCFSKDERVCDITLQGGQITDCKLKTELIGGKLIKVTEEAAEIEGCGLIPFSEDIAVYQLYGTLCSKSTKDLRIGYAFSDFVLEDGRIAACLMVKDDDMDTIRVLIKNNNYEGRYHERAELSCDHSYQIITYQNGIEIEREKRQAGESFSASLEDFHLGADRIQVIPDALSATLELDSVTRSQGTPRYHGTIEVEREAEGLIIINEVLLEDYLCKVVPSEMPSSYPQEALKAQAVCARTYAYGKMIQSGLPALGAHVDDSAGFQVYNNISEQASTTKAVKATKGEILTYEGVPVGAYYYSTSCGVGTDTGIWNTDESDKPAYLTAKEIKMSSLDTKSNVNASDMTDDMMTKLEDDEYFTTYIQSIDSASYEKEEGWYRWNYTVEDVDVSHIEEILAARYESYPNQILTKNSDGTYESKEIGKLGKLKDIKIIKRYIGGIAEELLITGTKSSVLVTGELNIRYVLNNGEAKIYRQSGDTVDSPKTLPSAFFAIDTGKENGYVIGYTLSGGGFGHGVGMSQNGAKAMAGAGMNCDLILQFFYGNSEVTTMQGE